MAMKKWDEGKEVLIKLNEFEVTLLLTLLGKEEAFRFERGVSSKAVQILITKIYRAMGVKV